MNFKKIEIYGFKSFADKLELKFESGVTGIVGPNGCGKSNVADSIRWVLGEQSAKALRGSSMQDVIFNGTEKRRSQSFAEVVLFFDNTNKIFPLDYDEVAISRKLYRSGESEYAINKNPCRLKDIVDCLRDSGLGKESYSIIGQGRIDELLSAKPEDRRAVFEEAAGIAKFKSRKLEAERKLERTHLNLSRINDIVFELEKQIEPLSKQAEIAKTYLELKERLKLLEVNTYIYQYDNASSMKEQIKQKLTGIEEDLNQKQADFEKALAEFNHSLENIHNLDESIEQLRDELLSLTVGLEKDAGETRLLQQKCDNAKTQLTKTSNLICELETSQKEQLELLESKRKQSEFNQIVIDEQKSKLEGVSNEYLEVVDKITESEENVELSGNEMLDALGALSDVKSKLSALETEKDNVTTRKSDIVSKREELLKKLASTKSILTDDESDLRQLVNEKERILVENDKNTLNYNNLCTKLSQLSNQIEKDNASFHSLSSRNKLLVEMQENNEGFIVSVQKLLHDTKVNKTIKNLIVGVVANLISVPKKYETAIETALGAAVQNIVTKNPDDAQILIDYLKEQRYGRITFLPISSMKPRSLSSDQKKSIDVAKSFGVALDLIGFDKSLQNVMSSLLGSTVVVEDMKTAVSIAKETNFSVRIVTLDGDVIATQGSLAGGSKKFESTNLIGRENEISENEKTIKNLNENLSKMIDEKSMILSQQSKILVEIKENDSKIHNYDLKITQKTDNVNKNKNAVDEIESEINKLGAENIDLSNKLSNIASIIGSLTKTGDEIENKKQKASNLKVQTSSSFDELKRKRESLIDLIQTGKIKIAELELQEKTNRADIERIEKEQKDGNIVLRQLKLEKQQYESQLSLIETELNVKQSNTENSKNAKELQTVRAKLSNLDEYKTELQQRMQAADVKKMQLTTEIQRIMDKKAKEEMQLSKLDYDVEAMQEKVWEDYSLTYTSSLQFKLEKFDLVRGLSESAKIKKQIANLGAVNVNAIEEVKVVGARYTELSTQRDDLTKAEADLMKIIGELESQMKSKFKNQFEEIQTNFQVVFKELFGGGRAELILQDPSNVLESGIDIIAEPPGKKLQSITLLSGGEKAMTAIAILFAILKLRPMPFCVLDEIEAALDDANAERFAKYLKRFSKSTQFIVITHRKPTMELADCLYGVTMEEKGVSKMVSVKLSEAVRVSKEVENK